MYREVFRFTAQKTLEQTFLIIPTDYRKPGVNTSRYIFGV